MLCVMKNFIFKTSEPGLDTERRQQVKSCQLNMNFFIKGIFMRVTQSFVVTDRIFHELHAQVFWSSIMELGLKASALNEPLAGSWVHKINSCGQYTQEMSIEELFFYVYTSKE